MAAKNSLFQLAAKTERREKIFLTALTINGVKVFADTKIFSEKELAKYVKKFSEDLKPRTLVELFVKLGENGMVDVETTCYDKFERIRRITGM